MRTKQVANMVVSFTRKILVYILAGAIVSTGVTCYARVGSDKLSPALRAQSETFANSFNAAFLCKYIENKCGTNAVSDLRGVVRRLTRDAQHEEDTVPRKIIDNPLEALKEMLTAYQENGILSDHGWTVFDSLNKGEADPAILGFDAEKLLGLTYPQTIEMLNIPAKFGGLYDESNNLFISPEEFADVHPEFKTVMSNLNELRTVIGCGNNCAFCSEGGSRRVRSLPYPIAVQCIMQKYVQDPISRPEAWGLSTYNMSEDSFHYHDAICDANIASILFLQTRFQHELSPARHRLWTAGYLPLNTNITHVRTAVRQLRGHGGDKQNSIEITFNLARDDIIKTLLNRDIKKLILLVRAYRQMYKDLFLIGRCKVKNRLTYTNSPESIPYTIQVINRIQNLILDDLETDIDVQVAANRFVDCGIDWTDGRKATSSMKRLKRAENDEDLVYFLTHIDERGIVASACRPELPPNTTVLQNEIIIELPEEGLAVRYFDPANADTITPYSDVTKLSTKVVGPGLNRQIIHRIGPIEQSAKRSEGTTAQHTVKTMKLPDIGDDGQHTAYKMFYKPEDLIANEEAQHRYLTGNQELFSRMLAKSDPETLIRVPVEAIESLSKDNIISFLGTLQESDISNIFVELFYMSGTDDVNGNVYEKFGLKKQQLPPKLMDHRRRSRLNTITLFPSFKGKEEDEVSIAMKLGSLDMTSQNTILSPIGLQNDSVGLIRATILGLQMMELARKINGKKVTQEILDCLQVEILERLKSVCDAEGVQDVDLKPEDIIALVTGSKDKIVCPLNKLIRVLPIVPFDREELRHIYEHAKAVVTAV